MDVHITLSSEGELTEQIFRQLLEAIVDGRLRDGERLPPTRELASQLKVSRNTVGVAYDRLHAEGLTTSRVGSGTFVSTPGVNKEFPRRARRGANITINPYWQQYPQYNDTAPREVRFNFATGLPDSELFPWDVWRRLLANLFHERSIGGNYYGAPSGRVTLRSAIARHIGISRSVHAGVDDVLVTHGAQQAIDLVCRVLVNSQTTVAVENPGYAPASRLFLSYGATVEPVPVDSEGLVVSAIPDNVRLIYTTPSHQFPLGMPMSLRRRAQLLDWAEEHDAVIIEDDYDSEFRFDERSLEPLQSLDPDGRVIYIGTFSKTLLPLLRIGFLIAPQVLRGPIRAAKQLTDWHNDVTTQAALAQFMEDGHFARHLRKASRVYGERHGIVSRAVRTHLARDLEMLPSAAGLHICALQKPDSDIDLEQVKRTAHQTGIAIQTLQNYMVSPTSHLPGFVIGFGAIATGKIEPGIVELARCFDAVRGM
jgi:GntR family transcriptional regulator/MocR family aminotransferase